MCRWAYRHGHKLRDTRNDPLKDEEQADVIGGFCPHGDFTPAHCCAPSKKATSLTVL